VVGNDAYKNVFEKAAAMLDSIAKNHGFRDGNKRSAMAAAAYYLDENDIGADYTNQDYEDFMLHVVNDKPSATEIGKWLRGHSEDMPATNWSFEDAQSMAKKHPKTFEIPNQDDINSVKAGSVVKLIFNIEDSSDDTPGSERMWVEVTKVNNSGYVGKLDNRPAVIRGLKPGDKIEFQAKNIASIWQD